MRSSVRPLARFRFWTVKPGRVRIAAGDERVVGLRRGSCRRSSRGRGRMLARVRHAGRRRACRRCRGPLPGGDDRADAGESARLVSARRRPCPWVVSILVSAGEVVAGAVMQGVDDRELVGVGGLPGIHLGDVEAGDVRVDRPPDAAVFGQPSGFMSYMSRWLGPPSSHPRMTDVRFGGLRGRPEPGEVGHAEPPPSR